MTIALAVAITIAGAALTTAAFTLWHHERETGPAAVIGVTGIAFVYAGVDFIARTLA